jgi:hypothetical protein
VRAHGSKRLLPCFGELQMTRIDVTAVRDWRAQMLEAVEAGEWAAKTINNARIALLGCLRIAAARAAPHRSRGLGWVPAARWSSCARSSATARSR